MVARRAAIDIGTNTVLLTIATVDRSENQLIFLGELGNHGDHARAAAARRSSGDALPELTIHAEHYRITRLGAGVDKMHALSREATCRTLDCLRDYKQLCTQASVEEIRAVGTSALRDARGAEEFLQAAGEALGVPIEVITGAREAMLTFQGGLSGLTGTGQARMPLLVFDIGGGSTEVIAGWTTGEIETSTSMNVGSVRLAERYQRDMEAARAEVLDWLHRADAELPPQFPPPQVSLGLAGTVTTLYCLVHRLERYDFRQMTNARLSRQQVRTWAARLAELSQEQRASLPGMEAGRSDVIAHGALICELIMNRYGVDTIHVSDRGVRHGLLLHS